MTKAAEVAMAPITKAFPTFSGALIVADALGNFGEFSVLTYFFHFAIAQLFDRRPWTSIFSFKPVGGRKSIQLNNIESVSTILVVTSVQKMNHSVVRTKSSDQGWNINFLLLNSFLVFTSL